MVGRYQSPELREEALAQEDLWARQGVLGRCGCLVGTCLTFVGLLAPILGRDGVVWTKLHVGSQLSRVPSSSDLPAVPAPSTHIWATDLHGTRDSVFNADFYNTYSPRDAHMHNFGNGGADRYDFRVSSATPVPRRHLRLDISLIGVCVAILALCVLPGSLGWQNSSGPWSTQSPSSTNVPSRDGWGNNWNVDKTKTGLGGLFGPSSIGANAYGWSNSTGPTNPWSFPSNTIGATQHGYHVRATLPTEDEVLETYATFGTQLRQWAPALLLFVGRRIIGPLLEDLDRSDQMWQQALAPYGWRLTFEAPRPAGIQGIGFAAQEIRIFDQYLPAPFSNEPQAVELWQKRQQLENYLKHPNFEPAVQRQYVLARIREWHQRGLTSAVSHSFRPGDVLPTDAHILENLIIRFLGYSLDFCNCFLASGQAPPAATMQCGQGIYLRQVVDQSAYPRPAPHYEVVVATKVWKLRPGSSNLVEALGLLLYALRYHTGPQGPYASFPRELRDAVEASGGNGLVFDVLNWGFSRFWKNWRTTPSKTLAGHWWWQI